MAPIKGKTGSSKGGSRSGPSKGGNKGGSKSSSGGSSSGGIRKKPSGKTGGTKPKIIQQKTKSSSVVKKKARVYSAKELGIPELNGIVPAGVGKPPNAKKGKNFVGDGEGMHAILAMVMAEKEGNIESKMMRARQLEEVREARKAEMEERANHKKAGFEERKKEIKDSARKGKRSEGDARGHNARAEAEKGKKGRSEGQPAKKISKPKKKVSFGS